MAGRVTLQPVPLNSSALSGGAWPAAASVGYDTGSPGGSFTAWGTNNGIQFVNNGQIIVAWVNGATAASAQILIGREVAGQLPAYTTLQATLTTSGMGWLGPFSPYAYNQVDSGAYSGAGAPGGAALGGAVGASAVGMTCIDFTAVTTVAVRLYQLIPAIP